MRFSAFIFLHVLNAYGSLSALNGPNAGSECGVIYIRPLQLRATSVLLEGRPNITIVCFYLASGRQETRLFFISSSYDFVISHLRSRSSVTG